MENDEIINLWKFYNNKLDESLLLNRKNAEDITKIKAHAYLVSMTPLKLFTIIVGILWVCLLDILIINLFSVANPFFLISAGIQVLLTKLAIVIYHNQSVTIRKVDISEPILATQEKIASLKASTLWIARILFLQLPVWTTFYWNESMLENGNMFLYILQGIVTVSSTLLAVWLFRNIKYENRDKKWFRLIFNGKEWSPIMKSMELLNQLDEYKPANKDSGR